MNEIKYRIYGKENRIMYSWEEILNFDSLKDTLKNGGKEDQYYSPLLPYTGIKDKNGKEIYVGDILKGPTLYETPENTATTYSHWKVTYGNCSFYLGDSPIDEDIDWVSEECEVVGNVYENPELLMKVFKMNDYDWVAAKNEEEAKNFYEEFIDREEIEEYFVGEVSLKDKMHISIDELPDEEQRVATIEPVIHRGGETCVLRSFEWVIKWDNITNPCIIASTEY